MAYKKAKKAELRQIKVHDKTKPEIHVKCVTHEKGRPVPYNDTLTGTEVWRFLNQYGIQSITQVDKIEKKKPEVQFKQTGSGLDGWTLDI